MIFSCLHWFSALSVISVNGLRIREVAKGNLDVVKRIFLASFMCHWLQKN
jgi:hypothetical protein